MSVYSKLSKQDKKKVFSGEEIPRAWMPSGSWDLGADYICFVSSNKWVPGSFKFVPGNTKGTVRAVKV